MTAAALLASALLASIVGAALIALSNRAHWMAVTGSALPSKQRRRNAVFGSVLLLIAAVLAVLRDGFGMGLMLGPLMIALAVAATIAILAVRPRLLLLLSRLVS